MGSKSVGRALRGDAGVCWRAARDGFSRCGHRRVTAVPSAEWRRSGGVCGRRSNGTDKRSRAVKGAVSRADAGGNDW